MLLYCCLSDVNQIEHSRSFERSSSKIKKLFLRILKLCVYQTEINEEEAPLCVICSNILAANSMKHNKLKQHLETLHRISTTRSHRDSNPENEEARQSENFSKLPDHVQSGPETVPALVGQCEMMHHLA
ncbi:hypothetical protein AVEN_168708-1 [Araneus ventricosus]|uniref:BED-type domain-containing protein n=1 Tax=Araneus ventricosus TaxID=182803 RepID=A0A4Y2SNA9_ARAVE|nr:hypothetical protein AVEN_168708-1 [Araneus ventricosus]